MGPRTMTHPGCPTAIVKLGLLALIASGCSARPSGPLTTEERQGIPGVIAFVSERGADKDVWLVRPTGEETRLTQAPDDEFPAAPAPGGQALLVVAAREQGGVHVEQLRLVTPGGAGAGAALPLHAPRARARNPSWAPDGAWFVAESDAQGFSDLVRMEPRAGAEPEAKIVRLQTAPEGNFEPSVSPDGKQVAFVSSRDGDPEIYVMDLGSGATRRLTFFHKEDWAPQWSPDGRFIAFLSSREGRVRVFVVQPDGAGTRAVSGSADTGEERDIAWSPDGRTLAFVGRAARGQARIWKVAMDGSPPVAVTEGASKDDQPAWSPDGKYLAYVSEKAGNAELFLMRADGSGKTRLTRAPGADWLPRWLAPAPPPPG
jgi:Tol biopolymer transport system component